jgi:hypothetical protein
VDQEQVEIVEAERLERAVEGLSGVVGPVRAVGELAGDEYLTTIQARLTNGIPDFSLVPIHLGGIDVPVTGLQGGDDRLRGVGWLDEENTEP